MPFSALQIEAGVISLRGLERRITRVILYLESILVCGVGRVAALRGVWYRVGLE